MSSLFKEINRPVKHLPYYYEKLLFSKLHFYREEDLKNKKVQGIFAETFILALSPPAVFRLQNRVSDFF